MRRRGVPGLRGGAGRSSAGGAGGHALGAGWWEGGERWAALPALPTAADGGERGRACCAVRSFKRSSAGLTYPSWPGRPLPTRVHTTARRSSSVPYISQSQRSLPNRATYHTRAHLQGVRGQHEADRQMLGHLVDLAGVREPEPGRAYKLVPSAFLQRWQAYMHSAGRRAGATPGSVSAARAAGAGWLACEGWRRGLKDRG